MNNVTYNKLSFVAKLFITILLIIIFEGAIRKWGISSAGTPLMLIRDFFVFLGIIYGIYKLYFDFSKMPEVLLFIWTVIIVCWGLFQFLADLIPIPVVFIGVRSWILYAWFSLLCFRALTPYDILIIIKILLISLIPMTILAIVQFLSPVTSLINKQAGGDDAFIFTVAKDIVRTTGTFTFTIGYTTYVTLLSPLVLFLLSNKTKLFNSNIIRLIIIGLFFISAIVSGSRSVLFFVLSIFLIYILAMFLSKNISKISTKSIVISIFFILISTYITYPILERAYTANLNRITTASNDEDVTKRIINTFIGEDETWVNFTFLGKGIGAGSNAARIFMDKNIKTDFILGEMEVDRIINEGGIIGVFFSLIKLFLPFLLLIYSFRILIKESNILPFLFSYYLLIQLLTTSLTGQITVHGFLFLALGLGLTFFKSPKHRFESEKY